MAPLALPGPNETKWAARQPTPFLAPWSVGDKPGRSRCARELNYMVQGLIACNHDLTAERRSRSDLRSPRQISLRDRCKIESKKSGRGLAKRDLWTRSLAHGHIRTALVRPQPTLGPRMTSVAARPIWEHFSQGGPKWPSRATRHWAPFGPSRSDGGESGRYGHVRELFYVPK